MLATEEFYRKNIRLCLEGLKTAKDPEPLLSRLKEYRHDLAEVTGQEELPT